MLIAGIAEEVAPGQMQLTSFPFAKGLSDTSMKVHTCVCSFAVVVRSGGWRVHGLFSNCCRVLS